MRRHWKDAGMLNHFATISAIAIISLAFLAITHSL